MEPSSLRSWEQNTNCDDGNDEEEWTLRFDASAYVTLGTESIATIAGDSERLCKIVGRPKLAFNIPVRRIFPVMDVRCGRQGVMPDGNRSNFRGSVYSALPRLPQSPNRSVRATSDTEQPPSEPVPLASITLRKFGPFSSQSVNERSQLFPLVLSCLKRQLFGRIVYFSTSCSSRLNDAKFGDGIGSITELIVPSRTGDGHDTLQFCVEEVAAMRLVGGHVPSPRVAKESTVRGGPFFLVLPSTSILLLEEEPEQQQNRKGRRVQPDLPSSKVADTTHSPAARLLKNAIQIVQSSFNSSYCFDIPRAFLLTGPPGVGKTFAVRTAAESCRINGKADGKDAVKHVSIRGSDLLGDKVGVGDAASELRDIFSSAAKEATSTGAVVIFLDECDALLSSDGETATAAMLGGLLDKMSCYHSLPFSKTTGALLEHKEASDFCADNERVGWMRLIVVASTNKIDAIPSFLRRPGRFDREVCVSPPNSEERLEILKSLLVPYSKYMGASLSEELACVAEECVGYVAADLAALVRRAAMLSLDTVNREDGTKPDVGRRASIAAQYLRLAMKDVGASALRDAALSAPPTTRWDDIAGDVGGAKTALRRAVEWPRMKKAAFDALGLVPPRGILMHGPPGCAKTMLARAAAGASGVAFLSLSPAEVYSSSYVGEAEAVVRRAFNLARSAAPCILFFDEIDSVLGCSDASGGSGNGGGHGMGRGSDGGSSAEARVLSTFLNEMDGVDGSIEDGVLVLGATNRPSVLDAALLRPGRFDKVIYVPPPDYESRRSILQQQTERWGESKSDILEDSLDLDYFAQDSISGLMTGAELIGACKEAAMMAVREATERGQIETSKTFSRYADSHSNFVPCVTSVHLSTALQNVRPLLSNNALLLEYASFENRHSTN